MINLRNNKGITLVALVITIIVLSIVAAITIPTAINHVRDSEDRKLLSEIEMVSNLAFERYALYTKTKDIAILKGQKLNINEVKTIAGNMSITLVTIPGSYNEAEKAYYELKPEDLKELGVENAEDTYILNYLTGEVINKTNPKTSSGEALYTYSKSIFK